MAGIRSRGLATCLDAHIITLHVKEVQLSSCKQLQAQLNAQQVEIDSLRATVATLQEQVARAR